jgi:Putative zinc-finger
MNAECPQCQNVNASLAGELTPAEEAAFGVHLQACPTCRAEWESCRTLLERLHSLPPVVGTRDLAPLVLAQVRATAPARWRTHARPACAAAAALLLLAGLTWQWLPQREAPLATSPSATTSLSQASAAAPVARALDWLVSHQAADGSWDPQRWGGQQKFAPALSALPLLALVTTGEPTPARRRAAARAAMHLMEQQNADGTFGPRFFGTAYNSSLSTLALLSTWEHLPEQVEKAALDAAVAALIRTQSAEGGWGPHSSAQSDLSITQWHVQALARAVRLGWPAAETAVARGQDALVALASVPAADAIRVSPPTSPELNFYSAYFAAHSLRNTDSEQASVQLNQLHQQILQLQATEGEERGSWAPDEQWGRAGGRLYATALAALALNPKSDIGGTR